MSTIQHELGGIFIKKKRKIYQKKVGQTCGIKKYFFLNKKIAENGDYIKLI